MRYLIVVTGRNCKHWAERSLDSIAEQQGHNYQVCVVDDASDDGTWDIVAPYCDERHWLAIRQPEIQGAMANQVAAWRAMEPDPGDVVVWCDLDDRLAHDSVLRELDRYYRRGILLTYGNYIPDPASSTCPPVRAYPSEVIRKGSYRAFIRAGGGIRYNHLRTVSWNVLRHLKDDELKDDDGNWFTSGPDAAVMLPSLELAGRRVAMIKKVLYIYTSDNPYSEWRRWPDEVRRNHHTMLNRPPRSPI